MADVRHDVHVPAADAPPNRERIVAALRHATTPLDDDELARRTGISPRQQVNHICRRLEAEGALARYPGRGGKFVNALLSPPAGETSERGLPALEVADAGELPPLAAGSSGEQRRAERFLLEALGRRLGVRLEPCVITRPDGVSVEVDGADRDRTILVECWAHQGPAKVAQRHKLMNDAVKLHWVGTGAPAVPRKFLCVSDEAAVHHLRGRSWQGRAIADLGVEIEVVDLPDEIRATVVAAQARQFR